MTSLRCLVPLAALAMGCRTLAGPGAAESRAAGVEDGRKLEIKERSVAELPEASGLASYRDPRTGEIRIYAIGDRTFEIAAATYRGRDKELRFEPFDARAMLGMRAKDESQWEAVAVDGVGAVYVLQEHPATLHAFGFEPLRVLGHVPLEVPKGTDLGRAWRNDANSQGEGFLLLRNGHVLLLKEKAPPLLIEFGPRGDPPHGYAPALRLGPGEPFAFEPSRGPLVALWSWDADDSFRKRARDASEISADGDGWLYALSDQDHVILSITGESDEERRDGTLLPTMKKRRDGTFDPTKKNDFRVNRFWLLPPGVAKPEGLAFVDVDRPIVATDDCSKSDACVFTLSRLKDE
jgi:hypothetical protein